MKMNQENESGKRFGHRTVAVIVTVLVLAAVILLNAGFTVLASRNLWQSDLTPEIGYKVRNYNSTLQQYLNTSKTTTMYTLMEDTVSYLGSMIDSVNATRSPDNPVRVDIIFCADPDILTANESMRYVYYTALKLEQAFPKTIKVSCRDIWSNPSSVDEFRTNSYSSIYQSNVIVASGAEYRICQLKSFYTYDSDTSEEPWAYNGEKIFARTIIAVTRAEAPICGITVNHGEPFGIGFRDENGKEQYSALLSTIESAGYDVCFLDLENDPIPENCRLILTFDPQSDFTSGGFLNDSVTSEIAKLDAFMEATYSFIVFVDADTPALPHLEEFLADWGIAFNRYADPSDPTEILGNYRVVSPKASLDTAGTALIATYEEEALGGSITENMRKTGAAPKIVFGNAMPIRYSSSYEQSYQLADAEKGTGAYTFGRYYRDNHSRSIYDVFRSSSKSDSYAEAVKDGAVVDAGATDSSGNFKLMTVTRENRTVSEGKGYTTVNESSYVVAFSSTDFASDLLLSTNAYGNTDVLLQLLRTIGQEIVPVGLTFKPLYEGTMTESSASTGEVYYTKSGNVAWTVVLTLLPGVIMTAAGVFVLVRRKYGH